MVIFNRVLLVDDSRSARFALRKMLERNGMQVDVAENAAQALEFLKDNHPDIIFMDHFMPGMDGFEASKIICSAPKTADIPIVMCTSNGGKEYLEEAKANGAKAVLTKPATATALLEVLDALRGMPIDLKQNQSEVLPESLLRKPQMKHSDKPLQEQINQVLDTRLPQFRETITSGLDMIIKPMLKAHVEKAMTAMRQEFDSLVESRCQELVKSESQKILESLVAERSAQIQEKIEKDFSEQVADLYSGIGELRASQSLKKLDSELLEELNRQAAQIARDEAAVALTDVQSLACQSAKDESAALLNESTKVLSERFDYQFSKAVEDSAQKAKQEALQVSRDKMEQVDGLLKKKLGKLFFVSGVALLVAVVAVSGVAYLLLT